MFKTLVNDRFTSVTKTHAPKAKTLRVCDTFFTMPVHFRLHLCVLDIHVITFWFWRGHRLIPFALGSGAIHLTHYKNCCSFKYLKNLLTDVSKK